MLVYSIQMTDPLFLLSFSAIVSIAILLTLRLVFKRRAKKLSVQISSIIPFSHCSQESLQSDNTPFPGIQADLSTVFQNCYITIKKEKAFTKYYADITRELNVRQLTKNLGLLHIHSPQTIQKYIYDFTHLHSIVEKHNDNIIQNILEENKEFFDHCLTYPLDNQQRRAIISEEDNCLVVSSAGSGKTSSIIGRVKYLIERKNVAPEKILLISYTNKAASELTDRANNPILRGYTFHKLALDIIGQSTGIKPSICDKTDALLAKIYHELLKDTQFRKDVLSFLIDYRISEDADEYEEARKERLTTEKQARIKAMLPDMDGETVYVKSVQEQKICFALSSLGIRFRYEEPYEFPVADEYHAQYKPDFSIYYEKDGQEHRIYLEHFGINHCGQVPAWFAEYKNISQAEANKQYNDGIAWKKAAHEKYGTKLIFTTSADFYYADIKLKLKQLFENEEVPIYEKSDSELYELILPSNGKQEKAFIQLISTFITLLKSSCKTLDAIIVSTKKNHDKRSLAIIKNIFTPIYKRYVSELKQRNEIDFTDAIIQATEICNSTHAFQYDHIIVDEFQDISMDRYRFLLSLRNSNPDTKLYCVGDDWQSIYRFSGSDMGIFNYFADFFGYTETCKIETSYRFGEPLISLSSKFITKNKSQIPKKVKSHNNRTRTDIQFISYNKTAYCSIIEKIISGIPQGKKILLLGRYSFDDYYLSFRYNTIKEGQKVYYLINNRKIEILTVHKSKGLEADYVIILQCNNGIYGFPSEISDDPVLSYVLTEQDSYEFGEERRLFYVAITRAKIKTFVLYDYRTPSLFVNEILNKSDSYTKRTTPPNANKPWTRYNDKFLLTLYNEGKSIKYISYKMGRSQTAIRMRLEKLIGNK